MVLSTLSIPQLCSSDQFGKKSSLHSRWTLPTKYSRKFRESPKKSGTRPQPPPELGQHQGDPTPLQKIPGEIRRAVLFRAESEPTELRKRVFGPRSLVFGVRGPLRKWGAPYSFESGLRFILSALAGRGGSSGVEGPGREKLLHWPSMVCWLLAPRP